MFGTCNICFVCIFLRLSTSRLPSDQSLKSWVPYCVTPKGTQKKNKVYRVSTSTLIRTLVLYGCLRLVFCVFLCFLGWGCFFGRERLISRRILLFPWKSVIVKMRSVCRVSCDFGLGVVPTHPSEDIDSPILFHGGYRRRGTTSPQSTSGHLLVLKVMGHHCSGGGKVETTVISGTFLVITS